MYFFPRSIQTTNTSVCIFTGSCIIILAMFLAIICVCLFPAVRRRHSFLMVNMLNENTGLLENTVKNPTESHQKNVRTRRSDAHVRRRYLNENTILAL